MNPDIIKYKTGEKILLKGNEAFAEGTVRAGCRFFSGYPITPQNEIPEYLSWRLFEVGGTFIQAESEVSAINMIYGAAACGARALTSSSGPGISLKQEGISYIAAAELPFLYANVMRGGPGLGNIAPCQSDYFQATRGGGHGDYRIIVLAPDSAYEMGNFPKLAYDTAEKYRNPCMILADGLIGQMMEPLEFNFDFVDVEKIPTKDYVVGNCKGREMRVINTLHMSTDILEKHNWDLYRKYEKIKSEFTLFEEKYTDDADIVIVAYGTAARISMAAIMKGREQGIKIGLLRPITLWPFPEKIISQLAQKTGKVLAVEMNTGQLVEDVQMAVNGKAEVYFYGRPGGNIPTGDEILGVAKEALKMKNVEPGRINVLNKI
ncbi:MAG: 3-methyl-2-oxobutanoate dehydrogenase subunit VorB [bacterium]|nr:3-methyl-2-oxobutanoate dehydrogenase subunit VorB [bacterium]